MKVRIIAFIALAAVGSFVLASCSTQARAERKGKDAGDQICAAKNADNPQDAQRHVQKATDKLNDLSRYTGRDIREDLRDLDRNLDQLSRGNAHAQDINAIERSIEEAQKTATGNASAAYDGLMEALADCD